MATALEPLDFSGGQMAATSGRQPRISLAEVNRLRFPSLISGKELSLQQEGLDLQRQTATEQASQQRTSNVLSGLGTAAQLGVAIDKEAGLGIVKGLGKKLFPGQSATTPATATASVPNTASGTSEFFSGSANSTGAYVSGPAAEAAPVAAATPATGGLSAAATATELGSAGGYAASVAAPETLSVYGTAEGASVAGAQATATGGGVAATGTGTAATGTGAAASGGLEAGAGAALGGAGAGAAAGSLSNYTSRQLPISRSGQRAIGVAGGVAAGAGLGFLAGGPVGAVAGGVLGGVLGGCPIHTASYGPHSAEVAIARRYRDERLDRDTLKGYYAWGEATAERMQQDPAFRHHIRATLVEPLVRYGARELGVAYAPPSYDDVRIAHAWLARWHDAGQHIHVYRRRNGELVV